LIFGKIIKIIATRCQILRLECTKFDFGWGYALDPAGGTYNTTPEPLAEFKEAASRHGGEGEGIWKGSGGDEEGGAGEGRERKGMEGEGKG